MAKKGHEILFALFTFYIIISPTFPPTHTYSTGFLSSVYEYDGIGENWILRSDLELEVERGFVATTLARGDGLQCYDEE